MTSKRSATRFTTSTRRTREEPERQALTGRLDTTPNSEVDARSWNYVTLGYGHEATFWRSFCLALRRAGYDDVLSIEHEDASMTPGEGVRESVELLRRAMTPEVV